MVCITTAVTCCILAIVGYACGQRNYCHKFYGRLSNTEQVAHLINLTAVGFSELTHASEAMRMSSL